jgi:hypothetical protein
MGDLPGPCDRLIISAGSPDGMILLTLFDRTCGVRLSGGHTQGIPSIRAPVQSARGVERGPTRLRRATAPRHRPPVGLRQLVAAHRPRRRVRTTRHGPPTKAGHPRHPPRSQRPRRRMSIPRLRPPSHLVRCPSSALVGRWWTDQCGQHDPPMPPPSCADPRTRVGDSPRIHHRHRHRHRPTWQTTRHRQPPSQPLAITATEALGRDLRLSLLVDLGVTDVHLGQQEVGSLGQGQPLQFDPLHRMMTIRGSSKGLVRWESTAKEK